MLAIVATLGLLFLSCVQTQQQEVYQIIPSRDLNDPLGVNRVTLTCRQQNGDAFGSGNAVFWINSTSTVRFLGNPDSKTFTIDNTTEGDYLCGEPGGTRISNKEPIIPYPQFDPVLQNTPPTVVTVKAGETAVLPPYILPGVWHSRYHIDWSRQINGSQNPIARVDGLRTLPPFPQEERYTINGDFSLMIDGVTRSDEGDYVGQLGVREASGSTGKTYDQTRDKVIKLMVYEPPVITSKPVERVMGYRRNRRQDVSFSCTATGYPRPTISWKHNMLPITAKYNMSQSTVGEDTVQSMLTLHDVNSEHSGNISCLATVTPGGNKAPESVIEVTHLSVLKINKANVHKTVDGDLIFVVHLARMVPAELQIKLIVKGNSNPIIVDTTYQNNDRFSYFMDSPRFDTSDFEVDVSVFNAKQQVESEPFVILFTDDSGTPCQTEILIAVFVMIGLGIICLTIAVISIALIVKFPCAKELKHKAQEVTTSNSNEETNVVLLITTLDELGISPEPENFIRCLRQDQVARDSASITSSSSGGTADISPPAVQNEHAHTPHNGTSTPAYGPPPPPPGQVRSKGPNNSTEEGKPKKRTRQEKKEMGYKLIRSLRGERG